MKLKVLSLVLCLFFAIALPAQQFTQVIDGPLATANVSSGGCSWADFNNDGYPDLFVPNVNNTNNQLFKNNGDGTFTEIITGAIVSDGGISNSAVWGDYNNDGNLDIFVSNNPAATSDPQLNFLYKNEGAPDFHFSKVTSPATQTDANYTWSSSWVDYDNDGDLDLHMPDNKHLRTDFFYENENGETFTAIHPTFVSTEVESTGVVSWIDYDHDGDQDLFMIKSGRTHPAGAENNRMFHNDLAETGNLAFRRVYTAEMVNHFDLDFQASWADYDNDGDMDVYLGNFDNSNYLYRNEGDSLFASINVGVPVTDNTRTLGSSWGDFDNDGDLDLFVLNTAGQASRYYRNDGTGNFSSLNAGQIGTPLSNLSAAQACANADYDNDGYLDLFVANVLFNGNGRNFLYHNNGGSNNFISIRCRGTISNAAAIGTKVWVKATIDATPRWQLRHITGSPTGNRAQDDLRVHFGLADADQVDSLIIEWPLGLKEVYTNIPSNQFLQYTEGQVTSVSDSEIETDFLSISPNPSDRHTTIRYHLQGPRQKIQIHLVDTSQKIIATLFDGLQEPGQHEIDLNTRAWASGSYYLLLEKEGTLLAKKMIILR